MKLLISAALLFSFAGCDIPPPPIDAAIGGSGQADPVREAVRGGDLTDKEKTAFSRCAIALTFYNCQTSGLGEDHDACMARLGRGFTESPDRSAWLVEHRCPEELVSKVLPGHQ